MKKLTLKIEGMHCASCPIMIDGTIEDTLQGIKSAQTSYAKQTCLVEYDEDQIDQDDIVKVVEGIGYAVRLDT